MTEASPTPTTLWETARRLREVRDASQRFLRLWVMQHSIEGAKAELQPGNEFAGGRDSPAMDDPQDLDD